MHIDEPLNSHGHLVIDHQGFIQYFFGWGGGRLSHVGDFRSMSYRNHAFKLEMTSFDSTSAISKSLYLALKILLGGGGGDCDLEGEGGREISQGFPPE